MLLDHLALEVSDRLYKKVYHQPRKRECEAAAKRKLFVLQVGRLHCMTLTVAWPHVAKMGRRLGCLARLCSAI